MPSLYLQVIKTTLQDINTATNGLASWCAPKCGDSCLGVMTWFTRNSELATGLLWIRGVNLYGLRVSVTNVCDLHGLTGVRCNLYGYLWFLQIQTYNHSTLYIRTVVSLQWRQLCFVSTKINDLSHNKLSECAYLTNRPWHWHNSVAMSSLATGTLFWGYSLGRGGGGGGGLLCQRLCRGKNHPFLSHPFVPDLDVGTGHATLCSQNKHYMNILKTRFTCRLCTSCWNQNVTVRILSDI